MDTVKSKRGVELLQGETLTLAASAARTSGANGDWVFVGGERTSIMFYLNITASATDAGDTLDVYIDVSLDGTNSIGSVIRFAQQAGNGSASKRMAAIDVSGGTSTTDITSDVAAGTVRLGMFGPYYRARWAIADSGNANSSHTFSVQAYAR